MREPVSVPPEYLTEDDMTQPRLFHDFETASRVDLKAAGLSRYARDPSTKPLMLAWAIDDEPVEQVVFVKGQKAPPRLREALRDPHVIKSAWNAAFERAIFQHCLSLTIPIEQWRDTMVLAYTLSLPGSLGFAGEVVNLPLDKKKDARGKLLMRKFSSPRKPTKNKPWEFCTWETDPEEFEEYESYNRQDVEAERAIWRRLRKWDLPEHEWALWHLDQRINEAGIPINRRVVDNAVDVAAAVVERRLAEMKRITGLDNPNSTAQLLPWLRDRGYPYEDLKKGHVQRALDAVVDNLSDSPRGLGDKEYRDPEHDLMDVLELRQEVSKSSVKKYNALQDSVDEDGVLRGAFQFAGAGRTWRWAGRKYQAQNLARPVGYLEKSQLQCVQHLERLDAEAIEIVYHKPMDLLSTCVRPVVQAKKGEVLIDADLNAIENRVLGWMAGEDKILQVFRDKKDPYIDFACHLTGRTYEELWHEYKVLGRKADRTMAKPGVLGCFGQDTLVLTETEWKRIVDVTTSDKVFDGVQFVEHDGVVYQGVKEVIETRGLTVTPDHKIKVGDAWLSASALGDESTYRKALNSARGRSEVSPDGKAATSYTFANALAELGRMFSRGISDLAKPMGANPAHRNETVGLLAVESGLRSTTFWRTGSMRSGADAKIPETLATQNTAAEGSFASSVTPMISSLIAWTSSALTGHLKLTERTTTGTMLRGIFDSLTGRSKTRTGVTARELNTRDGFIRRLSSAIFSRQRTDALGTYYVNGSQDVRPQKSSPTKPGAAVRTEAVWDVVNAGPRHCFMIWSEDGPLLAHNCGYMLGAGEEFENEQTGEIEASGLLGYAWNMGVKTFTKELSSKSVTTWRETYTRAVEYWYEIERAARRCILTGRPQEAGWVSFDMSGPFLRMRLPSGRYLHYCRPQVQEKMMPWGKKKDVITYEGLNDKNQWVRISTHPGKITENADQAISRDLLAHGMRLAAAEGINIRMHIHDQIVASVAESQAEEKLRVLIECMSETPAWAPGMPLASEGHISPAFIKD